MKKGFLIIISAVLLSGCQTLQGAGKDIMKLGHAISGDGAIDYDSPSASSYSRGYGYGDQDHYAGLRSSRGTSGIPTYLTNTQQAAMQAPAMPTQQTAAPVSPVYPTQAANTFQPPAPPMPMPQYGAPMQPVAYGYGQQGYGYNPGYGGGNAGYSYGYSYTPVSYSPMAGYASYY